MSATALASPPRREATGAKKPNYDRRTLALIEGPIAATLVRLAAPNMLVMLAQSSVGLIEIYFIGKLGTDALAGVALVFPVVMLMQMMSAGAMGGGISSAIARALGGGGRADADALALHALVIALAFGLAFSVALLAGGPPLYAAMGGSGASIAAAISYSNVIFAGAILVWLFNSLAKYYSRHRQYGVSGQPPHAAITRRARLARNGHIAASCDATALRDEAYELRLNCYDRDYAGYKPN